MGLMSSKTGNAQEGYYCFTLDDNIRFLEESTRRGLEDIFRHPYPALLKRMHEKYGAKFQMNMYYSYEAGGFSLAEVPDRWREELEKNADWLRFSFHARHNDPPFPYENAEAEELMTDYRAVMQELIRIAGCAATGKTTTLHYVCASKDACAALRREGVRGLVGMFHPGREREALKYYLSPGQTAEVRDSSLWHDRETDLNFLRNVLVINTVALEEIAPILNAQTGSVLNVMIHEQYYYEDYEAYQPDFDKKVEAALRWFEARGLRSCFFEELID